MKKTFLPFLFVAMGTMAVMVVVMQGAPGVLHQGLRPVLLTIAGVATGILSVLLLLGLLVTILNRRRGTLKERQAKEATGPYARDKDTGISTSKKWGLGWLLTILVLAAFGLVVWKVILPIATAEVKPDFTLTSPPDSDYIKLPMKSVITVVVMPYLDTTAVSDTADYYFDPYAEAEYGDEEDNTWTAWLSIPWGVREICVEPHEEIEVQDRFANGRVGEPFFDNPTLRLTVDDLQRADDDLTGVRFRNLTEKPIEVTIHLR
ncbi:MAG: hypothetical protein HYT13_00735 [Candidatus Liptonbacteria bacterium]|nr:hypothetical protein [Candidatus Liptonbacteria bacterium]